MQKKDPDGIRGKSKLTFTTIDDLIYLARELQLGLSKLGEYKYPLGVRKGVRKLNKERQHLVKQDLVLENLM